MSIPDQYVGAAIPTLTVYDSNGAVVPSNEYSTAWNNNKEAGQASVTVTAKASSTRSGSVATTYKDAIDDAEGSFLFSVDIKVVKEANDTEVDEETTNEVKESLSKDPLTLKFYGGAKYAGQNAVVYHVHKGEAGDELVPTPAATVDTDGYVTITVTQLSEFVIATREEKPKPETDLEVYRMYDGTCSEHFYTTDANEKDYLVSVGWDYEPMELYSAPSREGHPEVPSGNTRQATRNA